jgi:two-component system, NtrC family, sensor kinase
MKKILFSLLSFCITTICFAQEFRTDHLLIQLSEANDDTAKVNLYLRLSSSYFNSDPDSLFLFAQRGLKLAQAVGFKKGEMNLQQVLSLYWWNVGDYATAIKLQLPILAFAQTQRDTAMLSQMKSTLLRSYRDQGDYREALKFGFAALELQKTDPLCTWCGIGNADIGSVYYEMNKPDSALFYLKRAEAYPRDAFHDGWVVLMTGRTYAKLGKEGFAFQYYRKSFKLLSKGNNIKDLAGAYTSIAASFQKAGQVDSAIYYGKQALLLAQGKKFSKEVLHGYLFLASAYEQTDSESAVGYYKLAMAAKDSLFNQEKQRQILSYKFNEELRQNELKAEQHYIQNRNRLLLLLGVLACTFLIVGFLVRNNRQRKRLYGILQRQKEKIERTLNHLKEAQGQLVQQEKMASLGELTAGIAHEIQNPLNFVNNFSEVSQELVSELREELQAGRNKEAVGITEDLEQNLSKIHHHGQRADDIVKNMLQHSRTSSGKKQLTNLNALADEYLRLSYHGLRAKDKSFTCTLVTDFDRELGKVDAVPQDLGRVLLNLYNNAFYAVQQKQKLGQEGYEPKVTVSTHRQEGQVKIRVRDNGTGIPESVKNKIFQPFFTTKPTGQGTGLGLSLSYDIITKGHGGELKVESQEGECTEFLLSLPVAVSAPVQIAVPKR